MTSIEFFEKLKSELKVLRATTTLSASYIDHGNMGGGSSQLLLTAPPEVIKWVVEWINKEPGVLINKATGVCKPEVEKARLLALDAADAFKVANAAVTA